jgi:hypothetical protein
VLAGLAGGALFVYQEAYVALLPFVGLAVFGARAETNPSSSPWRRTSIDRAALSRYGLFAAGCSVGLLAFMAFNHARFGTPFAPGRYDDPLLFSGNPVAGLLSLLASPGKSIVLFSPPVILALAGVRGLRRRAPMLLTAIGLVSLVHVLVIIQFAFFGGDWCWGPRYLLVLVPLWALAFPFAAERLNRGIVTSIVALGLVVQVMAISVDHQRFFLERDFAPYFWRDQWVYFKHSQLFARPRELAAIVRDGMPVEATRFSPTPQTQITYTPGAPPPSARPGLRWARQFVVFHTFRPWPVWIHRLESGRRPVEPWPIFLICGVLAGGGFLLVRLGLRAGVLLAHHVPPIGIVSTTGR